MSTLEIEVGDLKGARWPPSPDADCRRREKPQRYHGHGDLALRIIISRLTKRVAEATEGTPKTLEKSKLGPLNCDNS